MPLSAQANLNVANLEERIPVNPHLQWMVDPQALFTIQKLQAIHESHWFDDTEQAQLSFGQYNAPIWFRLSVEGLTHSQSEHLLQLTYPHLDYLDVYVVSDGKVINQYATGDLRPHNSRPLATTDFVFPLPQRENLTVFIRIASEGVLDVRTFLLPADQLVTQTRHFFFLNGIYFGAALIMLIYNAFIYFTIRDQSYLYYLGYIGASAILQATLSGLSFQYLWPGLAEFNALAILLAAALLTSCAIGFIITFIGLSKATTPIDFIWLMLIAVSFLPILLSYFLISYSFALKATFIVVMFAVFSGFYLGSKYWVKGVKAARYFASAWFIYLLFIAMYLMQSNQIIEPNFLSDNAFSIGSLVELSLLSLAFADKLNEERELRVKAQDDLLNLTIRMNEELDSQVQARTIELENANARLKELSVTDGLTQLKNRFYFDQALKREMRRCVREQWPFSVIMLDIDHFKRLNDEHGHLFGDFCLSRAAQLVQSVIRRPSDTLARYGGEEFAILLPNTNLDGAVSLAEKIREHFKETEFRDSGISQYLTVSLGVSSARPTPETAESSLAILDLADQCLYKAKQQGRDQVVAKQYS